MVSERTHRRAWATGRVRSWRSHLLRSGVRFTMLSAVVREWFEAYRQDWRQEKGGHWAITRDDGAEVLGRLPLRGLGALTAWALAEIGFHRLELDHSTRNHASCRVAAKSGYLLEGTKRSAAVHDDCRGRAMRGDPPHRQGDPQKCDTLRRTVTLSRRRVPGGRRRQKPAAPTNSKAPLISAAPPKTPEPSAPPEQSRSHPAAAPRAPWRSAPPEPPPRTTATAPS